MFYATFICQKTVGGSEIQANVVCAWSGLFSNEGPKGDDHLILQEKLERFSSIELRKLLVDNPIRVTHHKIFPEAEALFRRHCYTEIENIIECKRPPFALAFRSQLLRPIKGPA